jgi:hypothetical protein
MPGGVHACAQGGNRALIFLSKIGGLSATEEWGETMRMMLTAVVLTVAVAGCNQGKTYPIAAEKVRSTLLSLRPPMMIFGGGAGGSVVTPTGESGVRWTIMSRDNHAIMSLVATIYKTGEAESQVIVSAEPAKSNSAAAKGMAENPAVVKLYTKAMTEQIAAKLEKREFDMASIQNEMVAATFATMPKIQNEAMKRAGEFHAIESEMGEVDTSRPGQPVNQLGER